MSSEPYYAQVKVKATNRRLFGRSLSVNVHVSNTGATAAIDAIVNVSVGSAVA